MTKEKLGFLDQQLVKRGRPFNEQKETPEHLAKRELILENEFGGMREDKLRNMIEKTGETSARIAHPVNELVEIHRRREGYKTKRIAINDIIIKGVQDYYFSEESLDALEKIKREHDLKTVGEAIDYLVKNCENSVN